MERMLVREKAETDPSFGSAPHERSIDEHIKNGIIILDKPAGPTSHQVSAWTRDIFKTIGVKKAGHIGTLDPNVTGVLPLLLQNSAKIAPALASSKKEYVCLMRLHKDADEKNIRVTAESFIGRVTQLPPKKAAVARKKRERTVHSFQILEIKGRDVLFRIQTEAGFYVRRLCEDFGKTLGTGAHMQQLRRTMAGPFTEARSVRLHDVRDAFEYFVEDKSEGGLREVVLPMERGVEHLKKILIKDSAVAAVAYGAPLGIGGVAQLSSGIGEGDLVAIMSLKGELVALGKALLDSEAIMEKRAGGAAQILRVTIDREVYPKTWK